MKRSGTADLPLRVPPWLASRMATLGTAIAESLGHTEKLHGLARLDTFARLVEDRLSPDADVDVATAHERALSRSLGGRTVFDDMKPRGRPHRAGPSQLGLFPPR